MAAVRVHSVDPLGPRGPGATAADQAGQCFTVRRLAGPAGHGEAMYKAEEAAYQVPYFTPAAAVPPAVRRYTPLR